MIRILTNVCRNHLLIISISSSSEELKLEDHSKHNSSNNKHILFPS